VNVNDSDPFGFKERYRNASIERLIEAFNGDVGNRGWVGARAIFHRVLQEKFLSSGFDCSGFISDGHMSLSHRIRLDGHRLIPVVDEGAITWRPTAKSSSAPKRRNLYYGLGPNGLVFVDEAEALELNAFGSAKTWGELRAEAPRLHELALELLRDDEQEAPGSDGDPFDPTRIPAFSDGDFPDFPEQLMLTLIPHSVQQRFGRVVDTVHNGQMLVIDPAREDEVVAALHQEGFNCLKRQDLVARILQ
jgi:hypothetical protein